MKNLFYTLSLITLISFTTIAQKEMNKWSIGVQIGAHDGMSPSAYETRIYQIHHYGLNGRYMINNRFGVQLDVNYDLFDFYKKGVNTNYFRTSIQGVVNVGDLLRFDTWTKRIGLLIHGGAGISDMWQGDKYRVFAKSKDPLFNGVDDMINYVFGVTPQVKLNERISLNFDLSFIFHHNQTMQFDMRSKSKHGAIDGYLLNLSVGASIYLGKHKTHADWTPTVYATTPMDMSKYDESIRDLQSKVEDDDLDGVPNYIDEEPETIKGSYVDSKGKAMLDTDGDGITDEFDLCPNEKGAFSTDGCPDSDGDGVPDNIDVCPDVAGIKMNKGCPEIEKKTKEVLHKALTNVQFKTNQDVLLDSSFPALDAVVKVLQENDVYRLDIEGHTDNIGNEQDNLILSHKRAEAVAKYVISKGIDSTRLDIHGYGETRPKVLNDTKAGRAINRRVEFTIVF